MTDDTLNEYDIHEIARQICWDHEHCNDCPLRELEVIDGKNFFKFMCRVTAETYKPLESKLIELGYLADSVPVSDDEFMNIMKDE